MISSWDFIRSDPDGIRLKREETPKNFPPSGCKIYLFTARGGNRNRNDKQLELNACMLAPTPLLTRQSPTVVRIRSRMARTSSNWTT